MTTSSDASVTWFSANRFGKWGECETRALADETTPAEFTAGPELLLGLAGHEALEMTLPQEFPTLQAKRQSLADAFWVVSGKQKNSERGVSDKAASAYAQALWDLPERADLWPEPRDILTVEGSGVPPRYLIPDIHGKPGFGVVLPDVFGGLADGIEKTAEVLRLFGKAGLDLHATHGMPRVGLRGRMDLAFIQFDEPGTLVVQDWGFCKEKGLIASMTYAGAAAIMFPGFARYVVREVYIGAGLRYSEQSWAAAEIPELHQQLYIHAIRIITKRETKSTTTTANARCDECQLRAGCETYQRALQPMIETPAEFRRWPTDLAALSTKDVMRVRRAFTGPAQAVKAYYENLRDELVDRLSGEVDRVSDDDGYGVRLSREGNGFEYEDVAAFIDWCNKWHIPLDEALKPTDNKTILRLAAKIHDEDDRQSCLVELDNIRDERQKKLVLRDLKGVRK